MAHSEHLLLGQGATRKTEVQQRCEPLLSQDDGAIGVLILQHDLLGRKAPQSQLTAWAQEAQASGYALGQRLTSAAQEPEQLADRLRVRVETRTGGVSAHRFLVAQYYTRKRRVVLYRDTAQLLGELISVLDLAQVFPPDRLNSIALAHELYHWAEADAGGAELRTRFRYPSFTLGPLRVNGRVMAAHELAAHGFAQGLCDLPRSPALLTVLLAAGAPTLRRFAKGGAHQGQVP